MIKTSVIALFCEDIRVEKSDILTLVGLLPDSILLDDTDEGDISFDQNILSKLHIYIRINFDPKKDFGRGELNIINPDRTKQKLGEIDMETVSTAKKKALEYGNALAGVITRATLAGFTKTPLGRFDVEVTLGTKKYLCGSINFRKKSIIAPSA